MNDTRLGSSSMKAFALVLASIGTVFACSTEESPSTFEPPADAGDMADARSVDQDATTPNFEPDAGDDGGEWFTTDCLPTTMCKAGVSLDAFSALNGVTVTETDVWAVGSLGLIVHHDGAAWSTEKLASPDTMMQIIQRPDGGLWAIGGPLYNGPNADDAGASGFARVRMPVVGLITALWAKDSKTAWAAGDRIYKIEVADDGSALASPYYFSGDTNGLRAIHGTPDGVLWAVGRIGSAHRIWTPDVANPQSDMLNTQTYATLNAVWPIASNDVWAVGDQGTIRHYTGQGRVWDIVESPVTTSLRAIWAGSANDVWAVGDGGVVVHYDGTNWRRIAVSGLGTQRPDLRAIWGSSSGRVFAVGANVILGLGTSVAGGAK
ncbi:hypothetical protein AKJ09_01994 [Labilithrix luteola]|uniref:Photosynthesis system II assembly factor Ycf48/Hcf136-like domain-containing protein n=1 Tax=Labilithrix luteola TaxID=1391654 RepID=A0A0K1PP65_9BACT|nr:hypothetical protein [Labilithrix luteola]AKU95330.1 hypothetical protein AKJ09_01994 [Labilithrix luteola]